MEFGDFLEFRQDIGVVAGQVPDDPGIAKQAPDISDREHQIEMVLAIALLDLPEFAIEILGFALHQADLFGVETALPRLATLDELIVGAGGELQVRKYISSHALDIGTLLSFSFESGPGQQSITGGAHAAALAEQVANAIRRSKAEDPDAIVHVFASVPNAMLFFFGQQQQAIAPCIVYEFDFDRRGNKSYQPSFVID